MNEVKLSLEEYERMKDRIKQLESISKSYETSYNSLCELLKVIAPEPLQVGILHKLKPHMISMNVDTNFEKQTKVFRIKYEIPVQELINL